MQFCPVPTNCQKAEITAGRWLQLEWLGTSDDRRLSSLRLLRLLLLLPPPPLLLLVAAVGLLTGVGRLRCWCVVGLLRGADGLLVWQAASDCASRGLAATYRCRRCVQLLSLGVYLAGQLPGQLAGLRVN